MHATADTAGTLTSPGINPDEQRPVRLLVPTERRTIWYVPEEDTLRAADLGLTRHTTDEELLRMVRHARVLLDANEADDAEAYLRRIRDGLRHPRDVADARAWGLEIPRDQNVEEFSTKEKDRLGWWWVLDHSRTETQAERKARLLADHRLIPMKGIARIWQRSYFTVKDFKIDGDRARRLILDTDYLREESLRLIETAAKREETAAVQRVLAAAKAKAKVVNVRRGPETTRYDIELDHAYQFDVEQILALEDDFAAALDTNVTIHPPAEDQQELIIETPSRQNENLDELLQTTKSRELENARRFIVKAMPPRRDRIAESDVWYVSDGCQAGRDTTRLDDWYEYNRVKQTGRPPGSRTRNRRPRGAANVAGQSS